jgi:multiple sugar transport system permease protein
MSVEAVFGSRLKTVLWYACFSTGALLFLAPILWMLSTSLKPLSEVFSLPVQWIPDNPRWENYVSAWNRFEFDRYMLNSLFVSTVVTALHVFFAGFAGFGLAKYHFFGRRILFFAILATLMLPIEVVMVPTFLIVRDLGWLNSYPGLIIPAIADAFGVFVMRQFIAQIPDSYLHAARIDGASELRIYFRVIVPLTWPAIVTLAIFMWRETWDAFVWPFLIISDNALRTLPLGLNRFQEDYATSYNELAAISAIGMIPLTLMFLLFQRAFIQGIAASGMKG